MFHSSSRRQQLLLSGALDDASDADSMVRRWTPGARAAVDTAADGVDDENDDARSSVSAFVFPAPEPARAAPPPAPLREQRTITDEEDDDDDSASVASSTISHAQRRSEALRAARRRPPRPPPREPHGLRSQLRLNDHTVNFDAEARNEESRSDPGRRRAPLTRDDPNYPLPGGYTVEQRREVLRNTSSSYADMPMPYNEAWHRQRLERERELTRTRMYNFMTLVSAASGMDLTRLFEATTSRRETQQAGAARFGAPKGGGGGSGGGGGGAAAATAMPTMSSALDQQTRAMYAGLERAIGEFNTAAMELFEVETHVEEHTSAQARLRSDNELMRARTAYAIMHTPDNARDPAGHVVTADAVRDMADAVYINALLCDHERMLAARQIDTRARVDWRAFGGAITYMTRHALPSTILFSQLWVSTMRFCAERVWLAHVTTSPLEARAMVADHVTTEWVHDWCASNLGLSTRTRAGRATEAAGHVHAHFVGLFAVIVRMTALVHEFLLALDPNTSDTALDHTVLDIRTAFETSLRLTAPPPRAVEGDPTDGDVDEIARLEALAAATERDAESTATGTSTGTAPATGTTRMAHMVSRLVSLAQAAYQLHVVPLLAFVAEAVCPSAVVLAPALLALMTAFKPLFDAIVPASTDSAADRERREQQTGELGLVTSDYIIAKGHPYATKPDRSLRLRGQGAEFGRGTVMRIVTEYDRERHVDTLDMHGLLSLVAFNLQFLVSSDGDPRAADTHPIRASDGTVYDTWDLSSPVAFADARYGGRNWSRAESGDWRALAPGTDAVARDLMAALFAYVVAQATYSGASHFVREGVHQGWLSQDDVDTSWRTQRAQALRWRADTNGRQEWNEERQGPDPFVDLPGPHSQRARHLSAWTVHTVDHDFWYQRRVVEARGPSLGTRAHTVLATWYEALFASYGYPQREGVNRRAIQPEYRRKVGEREGSTYVTLPADYGAVQWIRRVVVVSSAVCERVLRAAQVQPALDDGTAQQDLVERAYQRWLWFMHDRVREYTLAWRLWIGDARARALERRNAELIERRARKLDIVRTLQKRVAAWEAQSQEILAMHTAAETTEQDERLLDWLQDNRYSVRLNHSFVAAMTQALTEIATFVEGEARAGYGRGGGGGGGGGTLPPFDLSLHADRHTSPNHVTADYLIAEDELRPVYANIVGAIMKRNAFGSMQHHFSSVSANAWNQQHMLADKRLMYQLLTRRWGAGAASARAHSVWG